MWAILLVQRIEFLYDIAGVLVLNVTLITEANTLLSGWWLLILEEVGGSDIKR